MKTKSGMFRALGIAAALLLTSICAFAQSTLFTYQGRLTSGGVGANGTYDFRFRLAPDAIPSSYVGNPWLTNGVPVSNGLFTVAIDFGAGIFTGPSYWLEISVRSNGVSGYTTLAPLQAITPTPSAIFANTASNLLGALPTVQLSGMIPAGQLTGTVGAATNFSGNLSGDVTGPQTTTTVAAVGGQTAAGVATATVAANAATSLATPNTILKRDAKANFVSSNIVILGNLYLTNTTGIIFSGGETLVHVGNAGGYNNFFAGAGAGYYDAFFISPYMNTGVGYHSMYYNQGDGNTAVGDETLVNDSYGSDNNAIGVQALLNNQTGDCNVADGGFALTANVGGKWNTAIGVNSLYANTNGNYNTALGGDSLDRITNGSFNIAIGNQAGHNLFYGTNNIYIGNAGAAAETNVIRIGDKQSQAFIPGSLSVGAISASNFVLSAGGGKFTGDGSGITNANAATLGGMGATNFWQTTGNSGTTAGANFLGTMDNQALQLRVNNTVGLRVEPGKGSTIPNVIGGSANNSANCYGAFIGGGAFNLIQTNADESVIGGGDHNTIMTNAYYSIIGGGSGNSIQLWAFESTIGGGTGNVISNYSLYSSIGGGGGNVINGWVNGGTISGGSANIIQSNSDYSIIGGGSHNYVQNDSINVAIAGGLSNTISAFSTNSFIGGGVLNTIRTNTTSDTLAGGTGNTIQQSVDNGTIGGGSGNTIQTNADSTTIAGGLNNTIQTSDYSSTIGGGSGNNIKLNTSSAVIAGGAGNNIQSSANYGAISGGHFNVIVSNALNGAIGGGEYNSISNAASFSVIPGGSRAAAIHYGQFAFASGDFANPGDAQTSLYVLRNQANSSVYFSLYLDNSTQMLTVPTGAVWAFDALVVGGLNGTTSAAYKITGAIRNYNGGVAFIGTPTVTTIGADAAASTWGATVVITAGALDIQVKGTGSTYVSWVASVRTVEMTPSY